MELPPNVDIVQKFIFIHIPKNAGTSVRIALKISKPTTHLTLNDYKILLGDNFSQYFTFCLCRNPWARFLSLYRYAKVEENMYHSAINPPSAIYGKHADYELLKNASLNECAHYLLENRLKHGGKWNHWFPQVYWITEKNNINLIGRVEDMDSLYKELSSRFQMDPILWFNRTSGDKKYRDYYDPESRAIVAKYYEIDIETFGYIY